MINVYRRFMVVLLVVLLCFASAVAADEGTSTLVTSLKTHVLRLTGTETPRDFNNIDSLNAAADYVENELKKAGITTKKQEYESLGKKFRNIVSRIETGNPRTVLLGAHYDVWGPGPGADDNASGVAGLIELARILQANKDKLGYSVEIIAFTNEEPPFFRTRSMGSYIHAQSVRDRQQLIEYMVVLEMIGFYTIKAATQRYPIPAMQQMYPSEGNFIAVVGNTNSIDIVTRIKQAMQKNSSIDCQSLVAPPALQGLDFSDHLNYWALGLKAVMITDTAFYRNPNYHRKTDTPDTLNYSKMAEVVKGLASSFYMTKDEK